MWWDTRTHSVHLVLSLVGARGNFKYICLVMLIKRWHMELSLYCIILSTAGHFPHVHYLFSLIIYHSVITIHSCHITWVCHKHNTVSCNISFHVLQIPPPFPRHFHFYRSLFISSFIYTFNWRSFCCNVAEQPQNKSKILHGFRIYKVKL